MNIYIRSKNNKYGVYKNNAKRASKTFTTLDEAKEYAEKLAKKENGIVIDTVTIKKITTKVKKSKVIRRTLLILFIIFLITIIVLGYLYKDQIIAGIKPYLPSDSSSSSESSTTESSSEVTVLGNSDFQIHFLELGNEYSGDCTYIKAGEVDILIDAGSKAASATTIKKYVDQYCTDGKLEYVIATHAHEDHISGFVGNTNSNSGILYQYEIGTIIEFARSNSSSKIYSNYQIARDYAVTNGAVCYTANDCFNNTNNASDTFIINNDTTLQILYNKYYFEKSDDENDYSVCTLFTHGNNKFLLTGDLEEKGEKALANYYKTNGGLGHVDLFKAGHHGSKTSSNDCLLDIITPDICTICCCAGNTEYTANYNNVFPTQEFITRIAKHTDKVYATTVFNEKTLKFESLNGNIVISSDKVNLEVNCTNNNTKLKDTTWFNETVYVDSSNNICSGKGKKDFFTSATPGVKAVPRRVWPN